MIYSKTTEYAIRVLAYLATNKTLTGLKAISKKIKVPSAYISKVCQGLVHAKILGVKRGATGGYFLIQDAAKLRLADIIKAIDNPSHSQFNGCIMGLADCGKDNPCPLHDIWARTKEDIEVTFASTSLQDVVDHVSFFKSQKKKTTRLSKKMRKIFGTQK